jgi:hypothetical protein
MSVAIDDGALQRTRGRREAYLVVGTILFVVGAVLVVYGLGSASTFPFFGTRYSTVSELSGTFGGMFLGAGLILLMVGFALGNSAYVTR